MGAMQNSKLAEFQVLASRSEFDIFDRNPDPALDELVEFAAALSGANYAYIGWMDFNRLWFKARFGFNAQEQPRSSTACQWVLKKGEALLIRDAAEDQRFPPEGIPLAGAEPCRSYVGTPLITSAQQVVGTMALLAREPNVFAEEHLTFLEVLGRQAVTRLELYNRIRAQEQAQRVRQRTERALAIERCFVAATLDSIPALVTVLDTAGRVVRMNEPCAKLTGLSLADSAGRPFVEEMLEPDDRDWAAARLREAAAGPGLRSARDELANYRRSYPARQLDPAPSRRTQRRDSVPDRQRSRRNRPARDGTGAALERSALSRGGGKQPRLCHLPARMEGRLTSLNAFTAETLGYRAEALIGRACCGLLMRRGAATFEECLHTLETKEEWQGALPLRRSDGVYRRIAFRSRRMELPGERPFILNHGMDVTEQHEAEEALHLATRQRELILESVGDGIYGIDLDGRVTFINQAAARSAGICTRAADWSRHARDHPPQPRRRHAVFQDHQPDPPGACAAARPIAHADEVFWRNDGTAIPVEYSAKPLMENGQISGMVVAFQDISDRRRLERMKDEFISTVSHELRTPLTSLRASLGLIASGSLDKRPEKQRQMVEMAIGNCDRLVRLVNDILDFESGEKGKLPCKRERVEPVDLLRRARRHCVLRGNADAHRVHHRD